MPGGGQEVTTVDEGVRGGAVGYPEGLPEDVAASAASGGAVWKWNRMT